MADKVKKKILLVEDDVFMVDLLSRELGAAGFEVALAKNGEEGIAQASKAKPDLVILDLILPDRHGLSVLREIRKTPEGASLKVMVLSNVSEAQDKEEAKELGVADYLIKANSSLTDIVERAKSVCR